MKKITPYGVIGALIGLSVAFTMLTFSTYLINSTISGQEMLFQYMISLIIGIGCGVISTIFTIEKFTIIQKLLIHYFGILLLVLCCGAIGNWYETPWQFVWVIIIQIIIYVIVWGILYLINVKTVDDVNNMLKRSKK